MELIEFGVCAPEDMYHLIGALLLEFCVGFYGEFKMLEEDFTTGNSGRNKSCLQYIVKLSSVARLRKLVQNVVNSLFQSYTGKPLEQIC